MAELTLEQFLNSNDREQGNFPKNYMSNEWTKNVSMNEKGQKEAHIDVWLHTRAVFSTIWRHRWARSLDRKDGTKALFMGNVACLEEESVLRRQHFRTRDTNKREAPPQICPICRLIEQVRDLVAAGQLSPTDTLFKYVNGDKTIELHAAGIYNGFKNPSEAMKEKARAAGIFLTEVFKENCVAECSYAFPLVVDSKLEDGVIVSVEKKTLGDAVKRLISNEIESRGEEGNPILNPYALRFKYYPDNPPMSKFDASTMYKKKLTDEVRNLITVVDPPVEAMKKLAVPPNMRMLRATMEEHCLVTLDWDDVFSPAERYCDEEGNYNKPVAAAVPNPIKLPSKPVAAVSAAPAAKAPSKRVAAPEPVPVAVTTIPCDVCKAPMREDQEVCTSCGKKYEFVDSDEAVPF